MTDINFEELFQSFNDIKVAVIGDLMLDTYWWGKVDRISPEAPVPVVAVSKKEQRIGGAGNVALNIQSLGATVSVISMTGDDAEGEQLIELLNVNNINTAYLVKSPGRITTNKIRIISRNQHMMRLDAEITNDINTAEEDRLLTVFERYIQNELPHIVILEDYNKGILSVRVISRVIELCKANKILTAVDPKRKNFFAYRNADIFKPNLHEAREALNIIGEEVSESLLNQIHEALYQELKHHVSFITLSEKGVYFQNKTMKRWIHTHVRSIADVSGAGDTVIAVASLVYAATHDSLLMAEMANIAGGLVCEEVGTVAINKRRLHDECQRLLSI